MTGSEINCVFMSLLFLGIFCHLEQVEVTLIWPTVAAPRD